MKTHTLAVIPARSGSKGVAGKNIRLLLSKPLIVYTIEAAQRAKTIDKIIISTDDKEIARVCGRHGAEVPFMRPKPLARGNTPMLPVLQHAVKYLKEKQSYKADIVVLLQPTSPLRKSHHIDMAVRKLLNTKADSAVTFCEAAPSPYWFSKIVRGRVVPFLPSGDKYTRRQDLPKLYEMNGAVYATRYDCLMRQRRILGKDTRPILMSREESINIDTELDLKIAEALLRKGHR